MNTTAEFSLSHGAAADPNGGGSLFENSATKHSEGGSLFGNSVTKHCDIATRPSVGGVLFGPNGTTVDTLDDGTIIHNYANGDQLEKKPDGTTIRRYRNDSTIMTDPDGISIRFGIFGCITPISKENIRELGVTPIPVSKYNFDDGYGRPVSWGSRGPLFSNPDGSFESVPLRNPTTANGFESDTFGPTEKNERLLSLRSASSGATSYKVKKRNAQRSKEGKRDAK